MVSAVTSATTVPSRYRRWRNDSESWAPNHRHAGRSLGRTTRAGGSRALRCNSSLSRMDEPGVSIALWRPSRLALRDRQKCPSHGGSGLAARWRCRNTTTCRRLPTCRQSAHAPEPIDTELLYIRDWRSSGSRRPPSARRDPDFRSRSRRLRSRSDSEKRGYAPRQHATVMPRPAKPARQNEPDTQRPKPAGQDGGGACQFAALASPAAARRPRVIPTPHARVRFATQEVLGRAP